jgi:hypothetical protein
VTVMRAAVHRAFVPGIRKWGLSPSNAGEAFETDS